MAVNLNKEKKRKYPWIDWETYLIVGLMSICYLALAVAVIMFIVYGFIQQPIVTSIVIGVIVGIVPLGYFVVHVLGKRPDEW
jgi:hypothetical protein